MLSQCPNRLPHRNPYRESTLLSPPRGAGQGDSHLQQVDGNGSLGCQVPSLNRRRQAPAPGLVLPSAGPVLCLLCFCFGSSATDPFSCPHDSQEPRASCCDSMEMVVCPGGVASLPKDPRPEATPVSKEDAPRPAVLQEGVAQRVASPSSEGFSPPD